MSNALFVAWRSAEPNGGQWGPIGRLEHGPSGYRFTYTRGVLSRPAFVPFSEMPDVNKIYESDELFPLFANRLLARSRPEYKAYLTWSGFALSQPPDPIAVLGVTEGRRATDSLELFPCPVPDAYGCYLNKFFLHGVGYVPTAALERIAALKPDEQLIPMFDDFNPTDPDAVAVRTADVRDRVLIGYVPRYLAREIRLLCGECDPDFIDFRVERVNPGAPLQQRVLCRWNSCWPEGFCPCDGEDFQPIPSHVPTLTS